MEVLLDMVWLSGREGYCYSSVSCWDHRSVMCSDGIVGSHNSQHCREGARSHATSLVAYLGDLVFAIKGMQNMLARGPKDLLVGIS